jgi:lipopolysaccharide/colanic/teichoic acid biosynthesis glycosyltransferase
MDSMLAETDLLSVASLEDVVSRPLVENASCANSPFKWIFDVVIAGLILLLASPILTFIAIVIKIESPGPVFFCQNRFGLCGKIFRIYKFRTMFAKDTDYNCLKQTQHKDSRVTRFGGFLRSHSLDELPQLLNVLTGDMSLVGPRPHAVGMIVEGNMLTDLDNWEKRYAAKPGLTGWAQINGSRGALNTIESAYLRLNLDLIYIKQWSFWHDMQIILRTIKVCIKDRKAC